MNIRWSSSGSEVFVNPSISRIRALCAGKVSPRTKASSEVTGTRPEPPRLEIPRLLSELDDFAYLGGRGMEELLDAERRGTQLALAAAGRPSATITLPRLDARALGEVLLLLEAATAFAGPLYGVDPYDQPGVEAGKRIAFALMGRAGYERDVPPPPRRDPRWTP